MENVFFFFSLSVGIRGFWVNNNWQKKRKLMTIFLLEGIPKVIGWIYQLNRNIFLLTLFYEYFFGSGLFYFIVQLLLSV